jgi:hypothetical protein
METAITGTARRELGFVVFLASAGLALVMLVAFVPWYGALVTGTGTGTGTARPAVVQPAKVTPAKAVPIQKAIPVAAAEVDAALGR